MNGWASIIKTVLARNKGLSFSFWADKLLHSTWYAASAPVNLRACNKVGIGARTVGSPIIRNRGHIEIGARFRANSRWCTVELATGPCGTIQIGDDVGLGFGSIISAKSFVKIGNRVSIGQYTIVADSELPEPLSNDAENPQPIEIEDDVWLAGRVTVSPGARVGKGSVITAGSVVSGEIPPFVVAGGAPARVIRPISSDGTPEKAPLTDNRETASSLMRVGISAHPKVTIPGDLTARGMLLADFTINDLARHLASPEDGAILEALVAPFDQVVQGLLEGPPEGYRDFAIVWTRPERAIPSFARVLDSLPVPKEDLLYEVDAFCALVIEGCRHYKSAFVPTWTLPPWRRGLGMLEGRESGAARILIELNLRLMQELEKAGNIFVLDAQRWVSMTDGVTQSSKLWYLGKLAFNDAVFAVAAKDIKAAVRGLSGKARKLVVLDLDDTLWGGIVGDVGWQKLQLGGHDPVGEAFVGFQQALKALTNRGVLLGLVSKNEESIALEAIRSHPAMVLHEDDFVGWRINWRDKAQNIIDLLTDVNLGLQSVVFIDGNPVERGRVREALPEVFVPEWPEDKLLYAATLAALDCFDVPAITSEDAERTKPYAAERKREELKRQITSIDEWLNGLDTRVKVEELGPANLTRTVQLVNKANQMNLSTRRLTEQALTEWAAQPANTCWAVSFSDRFGDAGLTGMVSLVVEGQTAHIVDYVLSGRVMGRKVEETMVHLAVAAAQERGATIVEARLLLTAQNKPCLDFWRDRSGFEMCEENVFRWDCHNSYALPECIHLELAQVLT